MNRQDLGKKLLNALTFGAFSKEKVVIKVEKPKVYKHRGGASSGLSGIPTIQGIRMAQNRKNGIALKQKRTAKRLLLLAREEK